MIRIRFQTISCGTILGYPQNRIRFVYDFRRFHWHDFGGTLKIVYDSCTILDDIIGTILGGCRKSYTIRLRFQTISGGRFWGVAENRIRFVYDFRRFHVDDFGRSFKIVYDSYTILDDFIGTILGCPQNRIRFMYDFKRFHVVPITTHSAPPVSMKSYDFDTKSL